MQLKNQIFAPVEWQLTPYALVEARNVSACFIIAQYNFSSFKRYLKQSTHCKRN